MLKKMSLSCKIGCGFGVVLLLMIVVSAVAWRDLKACTDHFHDYRALARHANIAGRLQAKALMIELSVKDFLDTENDKDVEEMEKYHKQMKEFLTEAREEITEPERVALIAKQNTDAEAYDETFAKVVQLTRERKRIEKDVLVPLGPSMETDLASFMESVKDGGDAENAYQAGIALRHMLLGRLYVSRFITLNDKAMENLARSELTEMQNQAAELQRALANPQHQAMIGKVMAESSRYLEGFDKLAQNVYARNDLVANKLDVLGAAMAEDVETIKLSLIKEQDAIGPAVMALASNSVRTVLLTALAALGLGLASAYLILRAIIGPVRKMEHFIGVLAGGDFTPQLEIEQ